MTIVAVVSHQNFFLCSCRARSRLWRSSKHLWFSEEIAQLAQGKCRAKNPGAIQVNKKPAKKHKTNPQTKNRTKTQNPARMHPDRWNGETPRPYPALSRTPHRNRIAQSISLPRCQDGIRSRQFQCCPTVNGSHEDPLVPMKEVQGQLHSQSFTAALVHPYLVCHTWATLFSCQRIHLHDVASAYSKWIKWSASAKSEGESASHTTLAFVSICHAPSSSHAHGTQLTKPLCAKLWKEKAIEEVFPTQMGNFFARRDAHANCSAGLILPTDQPLAFVVLSMKNISELGIRKFRTFTQ